MTHILVVEDDKEIQKGLRDLLEYEGYQVSQAFNGDEGMQKALSLDADLVLLDIMLPGPDGYEILKSMRADNVQSPVIFLSAKSQQIDKVLGFRLGADDYVVKPFGTEELLARIQARLKRPQESSLRTFEFGEVVFDGVASKIVVKGKDSTATLKEKELLAFLIRHPNVALTRKRLLDEIWGFDSTSTLRTVDSHIFSLRKKIEPNPKEPRYIISIRNVGYRFETMGKAI